MGAHRAKRDGLLSIVRREENRDEPTHGALRQICIPERESCGHLTREFACQESKYDRSRIECHPQLPCQVQRSLGGRAV